MYQALAEGCKEKRDAARAGTDVEYAEWPGRCVWGRGGGSEGTMDELAEQDDPLFRLDARDVNWRSDGKV